VAIMTDEVGWHTRQLQAALRRRGAVGRCIDLADCAIDTAHAWHGLRIPGFGRELPDARHPGACPALLHAAIADATWRRRR
jgi:hypothetical protein